QVAEAVQHPEDGPQGRNVPDGLGHAEGPLDDEVAGALKAGTWQGGPGSQELVRDPQRADGHPRRNGFMKAAALSQSTGRDAIPPKGLPLGIAERGFLARLSPELIEE